MTEENGSQIDGDLSARRPQATLAAELVLLLALLSPRAIYCARAERVSKRAFRSDRLHLPVSPPIWQHVAALGRCGRSGGLSGLSACSGSSAKADACS